MNSKNNFPLVRIENVFFRYNTDAENTENKVLNKSDYVLKNINLDIREGTFTAVLGHNGSGKSTLAKLINAILTPTEGRIYINGKDISETD
ncbi:MAG: ATP-binding cassette domain-containing protein, partial [Oscillospiraceae bacterium]|nr:ATP-binding cassette domain-containing protein [Oscillospiraceae bacterium]